MVQVCVAYALGLSCLLVQVVGQIHGLSKHRYSRLLLCVEDSIRAKSLQEGSTKTVTLPPQDAIVEQMHSQGAAREVLHLNFAPFYHHISGFLACTVSRSFSLEVRYSLV